MLWKSHNVRRCRWLSVPTSTDIDPDDVVCPHRALLVSFVSIGVDWLSKVKSVSDTNTL